MKKTSSPSLVSTFWPSGWECFQSSLQRSSIPLLILSIPLILIGAGCQQTATAPGDSKSGRQIGTVNLSVDFGGRLDDVNVQIPCSADSTVFDILNRAVLSGDLKMKTTGSGETAFVHSINEIGKDAGDGESGKFWTYQINGQFVKTGSGVTEVDPGDVVKWRYGTAPADLFE